MPRDPRVLERHPEVERFAVIDDEDDELDDLPLFQPSSSTGLSEQIARGVTSYLCGETDEDMRCNRLQRVIAKSKRLAQGTRRIVALFCSRRVRRRCNV